MRYQGKIVQWFEEKGDGYIQRDDGMESVPLYGDAIHHGQSKPKVGDLVTFEIIETDQGLQAQNILYVQRTQPTIKPTRFERPPIKKNYTAFILMVVFGFLVLKFIAPKGLQPMAVSEDKNTEKAHSTRVE